MSKLLSSEVRNNQVCKDVKCLNIDKDILHQGPQLLISQCCCLSAFVLVSVQKDLNYLSWEHHWISLKYKVCPRKLPWKLWDTCHLVSTSLPLQVQLSLIDISLVLLFFSCQLSLCFKLHYFCLISSCMFRGFFAAERWIDQDYLVVPLLINLDQFFYVVVEEKQPKIDVHISLSM